MDALSIQVHCSTRTSEKEREKDASHHLRPPQPHSRLGSSIKDIRCEGKGVSPKEDKSIDRFHECDKGGVQCTEYFTDFL